MLSELTNSLYFIPAGLDGTFDWLRSDWVAPVFLAIVIIFAVILLVQRSFKSLLTFAALAAVAGLLIFGAEGLFGSKDATLTGVANKAAGTVSNTIDANYFTHSLSGLTR